MNFNGTFAITAQTEIGTLNLTLVFKEENGVLTGTSDLYGSVVELQNGKVEGNTFSYEFWAVTNYGSYYLYVKGELEGDTIRGNMTGETYVTFTGTRA